MIIYLTILLSILFAIGFGVLVRQDLVGCIKAGWISKTESLKLRQDRKNECKSYNW